MSREREIKEFETRFSDEIFEVAVVTGAVGVGAGKGGGNVMWHASIDLIGWKNLSRNESVIQEKLRLSWLVDDEGLKQSREILDRNRITKLKVRKGKDSMMLIKVLEIYYEDQELQELLEESLKPVFYHDETLGEFSYERELDWFKKDVFWGGQNGSLYIHKDIDENMSSALKTARVLIKDEETWSKKVKEYAADEMLDLANEWLADDDEAEIDIITKEMFVKRMELSSISVYPDGSFEMFFDDGDMFWGHSIIVAGNINGEMESAHI
ncbi:DUF2262 domain-containing protein [Paenibacillus radicis (ex Gao et al. 2016)]|uniref:Membrane protein n=1 Tax=Paenibacillus radicis (ex Gao et al. 2016) TaxID=1737354 RepID=A0A917H785_9BACL|nr:DUF2262 domain-containing protein [Paenibacillus radicis (ex Gao et al. 2016)]GGG70345.1 membrane protein [Paenibacillus radicis (ex Gao et al. 2016)]